MATKQSEDDEKVIKTEITIEWQDLTSKRIQLVKPKKIKQAKRIKVKIKHKSKDEIKEEKTDHEYADTDTVVKATGVSGAVSGAGTYAAITVAEGFVEGALLEVVGIETLAAIGLTAVGAGVFIAVGGAGILAYNGYTHWCNEQEQRKLETKQKFNSEVKLYNTRLEELKKIGMEVTALQKELQSQEDKINDKTWQIERHGAYTKLLVSIGPTGYGKSLVCNRLLGDQRDILDLAGTKNSMFDVARFGDTKSNTKELGKKSKRVIIDDGTGKYKKDYVLSVVDTQGAFDSDGDDKHFLNEMKEYFKACGGVNMFCIFFTFNTKMDNNYQKLIELYAKFWGNKFWEKCVVIVTHCDMDSKRNKKILEIGYEKTVTDIKLFLRKVSDGLLDDVPIYQFGEENFKESTIALLSSLNAYPYSGKYKCDGIKSPMDELWDKIRPKLREMGFINKELATLNTKMKNDESKISK